MLRVLSTFSGISAASIAWRGLGYTFVGFAEIEPFPCHVLANRCGASRPKYLPDPDELGIDGKEKKTRASRIKAVADLPEEGVINFGDISQITDHDLRALGRVDVLEGGSPCQGFSFAGLRGGLEDDRSNLLLQFVKVAQRMRRYNDLRYVVWENVPGILSDRTNGFGSLLGALAGEDRPLVAPGKRWSNAGCVLGHEGSVSWRILDAQFWGVPQRRRRVFAFCDFRDRSNASGTVLFESKSEIRNSPEVGETGETAARGGRGGPETIVAHPLGMDPKLCTGFEKAFALKSTNGQNPQCVAYALPDDCEPKTAESVAYTLRSGSPTGGGRHQMVAHSFPCIAFSAGQGAKAGGIGASDKVAPTLKASESGTNMVPSVVHPTFAGTHFASGAELTRPAGMASDVDIVHPGDAIRWIVRRLLPVECERLQGFPDGWTDVVFRGKTASDGPRYKAIGNSMAVPCMSFIGRRLLQFHKEQILNDVRREAA
ncbi:DNA cytosine methyltransferase [Chelativorans sp. YIM 93263]|uniref:DNA cytosine methyltransferase n=1 Tax=Chelativorans sp. YIM 93263 TaxID=2906648 RepID=UPI00237A0256|nr:DNA cytosine methyltransferase [Chelativorans sp. YIM 93263]